MAGAALTALAHPRQPALILTGALAAAAGPLGWNATLRATPASQFFTDAPPAAVTGQLARHRSGVLP